MLQLCNLVKFEKVLRITVLFEKFMKALEETKEGCDNLTFSNAKN